jgi:Arc/MetJ family transcription regulator
MMRTTISIDDAVLEDLMRQTKQVNPVSAIKTALTEYMKQAKKRELLALRGTLQMTDDWQTLRQLDTQAL